MTKLKMILAAVLIAGLTFGMASNALAVDATGQAEATVVAPLTLAATETVLNFGGIVADGTAGTVTVGTDDSSSATVTQVSPPNTSRGVFDVTGDPSRTYTITGDTNVNITNGTDNMNATLTYASLSDAVDGNPTSGTIDGSGNDQVFAGGVLSVAGTESTGAYNGSFTVNVNY